MGDTQRIIKIGATRIVADASMSALEPESGGDRQHGGSRADAKASRWARREVCVSPERRLTLSAIPRTGNRAYT